MHRGLEQQRVTALRQQTGGVQNTCTCCSARSRSLCLVRTIHRILERHDLVNDTAPGAVPGRFERSEPNELWQMDSKGKYRTEEGKCHPLLILDGHSRLRWVCIPWGGWKENRRTRV